MPIPPPVIPHISIHITARVISMLSANQYVRNMENEVGMRRTHHLQWPRLVMHHVIFFSCVDSARASRYLLLYKSYPSMCLWVKNRCTVSYIELWKWSLRKTMKPIFEVVQYLSLLYFKPHQIKLWLIQEHHHSPVLYLPVPMLG